MSGLDDVRAAQDRDYGAEGIAMYVVLVDETDSRLPTEGDGVALGDRLDALRAEVAPQQRDDDLGLTATLLAAAAHADHRASRGGTAR